jgi:hypothetical protein
VWAYNGGTNALAWTNDPRFVLAETQWHRFTVRESYSNQTWDLFVDSIRVFQNLGMRKWPNGSNIVEFSRFTIAGARGGGWYVDDIAIGTNRPAGLYGGLQTTNIQIAVNTDDAEERRRDGRMNLADVDLDLGHNTNDGEDTARIVGLRFGGIGVAATSSVLGAYVQFTEMALTDEARQEVCLVTIRLEATNNALAFGTANYNATARTLTDPPVNWSLPGWWHIGQSNQRHRTPDLSAHFRTLACRSD